MMVAPASGSPSHGKSTGIVHLSAGLPEGQVIALDAGSGVISYMVSSTTRPRLVMQDQFSEVEMTIVLPLFLRFPVFCTYEELCASFYDRDTESQIVEKRREILRRAKETKTLDNELRQIQSAVNRAKMKIRPFGFEIGAIQRKGYMLIVLERPDFSRFPYTLIEQSVYDGELS